MLKREKKNVDVAKNGDTGEKRKPDQSNPVNEYIVSLIFQRQDTGSFYLVVFLNYPRLSIESASIFFIQKNISTLVTWETVC